MEHKCILCGENIPDKRGGRCYCQACSAYMRAERERKHNEEVQVLRIKHEIEPKPVPKREVTLKKADMAYCRKCDYHGNFDQQILCEYMIRTGNRRGCHPGIGCEKRELIANKGGGTGDRECKRCGRHYDGGPKSNYCPECRQKSRRMLHFPEAMVDESTREKMRAETSRAAMLDAFSVDKEMRNKKRWRNS